MGSSGGWITEEYGERIDNQCLMSYLVKKLLWSLPSRGYRLSDTVYWSLDSGFWILDFEFWILNTEYWILDIGF